MPLIRHQDKIVLFVHIPKTGGTSVEDAMMRSGAVVALKYGKRFEGFMKTTFQHLNAEIYEGAIPADFYDYAFATVRHPVPRLVSEYFYRRKRGFRAASFDRWVNDALREQTRNQYAMDNHIRPQVDFLTEGVEVFRIEDGIDKPLTKAAEVLGMTLSETDTHTNRRKRKKKVQWTAATRARMLDFYAADFERFGYDPTQEFKDVELTAPRLRLL